MNPSQTAPMDTFLPPIEKPPGLMMKLAYYLTRRKFGKVLTPLKVHSVRLPLAFGLFYSKQHDQYRFEHPFGSAL